MENSVTFDFFICKLRMENSATFENWRIFGSFVRIIIAEETVETAYIQKLSGSSTIEYRKLKRYILLENIFSFMCE